MARECSLGKCCHLCGSTSHLQRECPERRSTFAEAVRRVRPSGGSDEGRRVEARPAPEQHGAEPAAEEVMEAPLQEEDVPISGSSGVVPPTSGAEVSVVAGQLVVASAGEGEEVQLTVSVSEDEVVVQEEAPPAAVPPVGRQMEVMAMVHPTGCSAALKKVASPTGPAAELQVVAPPTGAAEVVQAGGDTTEGEGGIKRSLSLDWAEAMEDKELAGGLGASGEGLEEKK